MKVLLINPPRFNELVGKNPSIIEKHRGFNPPLGILYLAASIKKLTDYTVKIIDAQPQQLSYQQLEELLRKESADVVGIPAMTFTLTDAYKTIQLVKKVMPTTRIVVGGTHIHLFPEETINLAGVDFALMGEAEFTFVSLLQNIDNPQVYPQIPGLVYKTADGRTIKNPFTPIDALDEVPFPDRTLLTLSDYNSLLSRGKLSTILVTSRGCPFQCAFCDRPRSPVTSHLRYRSAANVIAEIKTCYALGIRDFLFYDDTFTVNKPRVMEIAEGIISQKMRIRWDMRTRVDMVDSEMLRLLKRAGCSAIHYGVEAGNDRMLGVIKKGITVDKVKEVFAMTKRIGIDTLAYFMIGLPTETESDINDSFKLALALKPDYTHISIFSPYPGTELYELGLTRGIIKKDVWCAFAQNPSEGFKVPVWEENFTREELYARIVEFYKKFYLRPTYILKRISRIRSTQELLKKAKAGLSVLRMKKDTVDTFD